jgi:hypothetical protein
MGVWQMQRWPAATQALSWSAQLASHHTSNCSSGWLTRAPPPATGLTVSCVNKCDVDIRRDLYNGVVFTGGTSLITGAKERLERELIDAAPQGAKVKVVTANNPVERKFAVWIGACADACIARCMQVLCRGMLSAAGCWTWPCWEHGAAQRCHLLLAD